METSFEEIRQILKDHALTMVELRAQHAETEKLLTKSAKEWIDIKGQLADIGHSNGDAAENLFYNYLVENKKLGKIIFKEISKNVKQKKHRLEDEYDIFLENADSVGIIEVKYKVKKDHIENLLEKKVRNFRILFPDYNNYKIYLGIAGLSFEQEAEVLAAKHGLIILKQKGNLIEVNSDSMKAY